MATGISSIHQTRSLIPITFGLVVIPLLIATFGPQQVDPVCMGELDEAQRCTHGPDPAPAGFDIGRSVDPISTRSDGDANSGSDCEPTRQLGLCDGDGESGSRVQVIYARAADRPDRYTQFLPSFRQWTREMDAVFRDSAATTGGERRVRFVLDPDCELVIPNVVLSPGGDDSFLATVRELEARGFTRKDRKYLVYVDAVGILCGQGHIAVDDRPGRDNSNNEGPMFARVDAGCWDPHTAAHELVHNLGGVQRSAPNASAGFHCTDEYDVMCYQDGPGVRMREVCLPSSKHENLLDCNNDDYFHTAPAPGSYLANRWNVASSAFLIGTGAARLAEAASEDEQLQQESPSLRVGVSAPAAPAQGCSIDGRVYDAGTPAEGVKLTLMAYRPGSGQREDEIERVTTDSSGRYAFRPVTNLAQGKELYVRYQNARAAARDDERLSIWFGPDISQLSPQGCAMGGDFDIADVALVEPESRVTVPWGTRFQWAPRQVAPGLGEDRYQVCLMDWRTKEEILPCLPAGGAPGAVYAPLPSQRPANLLDDTEYVWYLRVQQGDAFGYSRWQRRITFSGIVTPNPDTPTPLPPTATSTPYATPEPDAIPVCPGDAVTGRLPVDLPPAPLQADVLLVFDATGSMGGTIRSAKDNAQRIMADLATLIPDIQFGVSYFRDYSGSDVYTLAQSMTTDRIAVEAALGTIGAGGGGGGWAEAYTRALYETYADPAVGWRDEARRFVLVFGDQTPIDDDLNEGIVAPPQNPAGIWCGMSPAYCLRDAGRDGVQGTADDLDLQLVLAEMKRRETLLLFVVSDSMHGPDWRATLLYYWKQWARMTGLGGNAVNLDDPLSLPETIVELVRNAGSRVDRLELVADPPRYASWLTAKPESYDSIMVPAGGLRLEFEWELRVPENEPAGVTHDIRLLAIGDGSIYAEHRVKIYVEPCVPPPTRMPPDHFIIGVPASAYRDFPKVYDTSLRQYRRPGPAGGRANSAIQVQNLDGDRTLNAYAYFFKQQIPYLRPVGSARPPGYPVEVFGVPPSASYNMYLPNLSLPHGIFSAVMLEEIDLPLAAIARTDWVETGGAALYGNVAPSYELSVPVVVRNYYDQTSIIAVMSDGNERPVNVEMTFYRSGSSTPITPAIDFELQPYEGLTFDLLDNHPSFNALGDGFLGSARLRLFYGPTRRTDAGARIGAISYVNIATSARAVWGFEALPSGADDSRAAERLYVPLWRSRQCGVPVGSLYDTGIAVVNPNDHPVEVEIDFYTTDHSSASAACRDTGTITSPRVAIPARSNHVFYQGPGGGVFPKNCFGSAVVRTIKSGDKVLAIVNDAKNIDELAAAYNAVPIEQAHTKVAVPLFRSNEGSNHFTTGIQVMNVGDQDAEISIDFIKGIGPGAVPIPGCGADCTVVVKPLRSHTWYPPAIAAILDNTLGSAVVESSQPVAVIVVDFPLSGLVDSAAYNGVPVFDKPRSREPVP